MAENQTLADLLRQKAESVINFPTDVVRNLTDPQAFLKSFGYTPNQQLSGYSAGYSGVPQKPPSDIGVLDPNNIEYNKGYGGGELANTLTSIAAPLASVAKPFVKPVAKAIGEHAWNATEKMMQQQGLMPSIVPRDEAEDFAKKIRNMGFEANINHSGSKAGLSSYVNVSDPTTGRFIQYPYRFSDHSKGPFQQQFVNSVTDYEKQLPEIQKSILAMREMGVSPTLLLQQQQQKQVNELVSGGMKPRTAWKQVLETKNEPSRKELIQQQIDKIEPTITVNDRSIPVTLHPIEARQGNKIEYVNTDKFENAFKKDQTSYIGKGGTENAIGKRYENIGNFLKDAKSMNASQADVKSNGTIIFGDGRHRFSFLRDQGLSKIPISMDAESIKNAKKFGYID